MTAAVADLSTSVVICTMNRREDLLLAVKTIVAQTVPFLELIVVDAGAESDIEQAAGWLCVEAGLTFVYRRSAPSTTRQRNLGADLATGDILLFLDDDIELESEYHAELLCVYRHHWHEGIGGAQGTQTNICWQAPGKGRAWYDRTFLLRRMVEEGETRVQPSGNGVRVASPRQVMRVEFLQGFNMSFVRAVFLRYRFDESLSGYALKEDVDLSYRISRELPLYQTPDARLAHNRSSVARIDHRSRQKKEVVNNVYFFNKNMAGRCGSRVLFLWSMLGGLLRFATQGVLGGQWEALQGFMDGIREVGLRAVLGIGMRRLGSG